MDLKRGQYYSHLAGMIDDRFNLEELEILATGLGIDWDHLAGRTKPDKINSLLHYAGRHRQVPALVERLRLERPPAEDWPDPLAGLSTTIESRRSRTWVLIGVMILGLGLAGFLIFNGNGRGVDDRDPTTAAQIPSTSGLTPAATATLGSIATPSPSSPSASPSHTPPATDTVAPVTATSAAKTPVTPEVAAATNTTAPQATVSPPATPTSVLQVTAMGVQRGSQVFQIQVTNLSSDMIIFFPFTPHSWSITDDVGTSYSLERSVRANPTMYGLPFEKSLAPNGSFEQDIVLDMPINSNATSLTFIINDIWEQELDSQFKEPRPPLTWFQSLP